MTKEFIPRTMNRVIKLSDVKPVGNFDSVLTNLNKKIEETISRCHKEKTYNKALANFIKFIVSDMDFLRALEEGIEKKHIWDIDEAYIDLVYVHILLIKLNDCAHLYLNNIEPKPMVEQLNDYLLSKKGSTVYKDLKIIE